jgi:Universal stress protein family
MAALGWSAPYSEACEQVLRSGSVPVILLRPGGRRITDVRRLLVPVDGSPGGALALATAVGLARATSASISLVEVAMPIPIHILAAYEYGARVDRVSDARSASGAIRPLRDP